MSAQQPDHLNGQTNPLPSPNPSFPSKDVGDESDAATTPLPSPLPGPVEPSRPLTGLEQVRLRRMQLEAELAKKNSQITRPIDTGRFPVPTSAPRPSTRPRVWTSYEEDEDEPMGLGVNLAGGLGSELEKLKQGAIPVTTFSTPRKPAGRKSLNSTNGKVFDVKVLQSLMNEQDEDDKEDIITPRAHRQGRKDFDGLLGQGSNTKRKDVSLVSSLKKNDH